MRAMPRHPRTSASVAPIGESVFSALADRVERATGTVYPLHVGDTWLEPPEGCRMEDLAAAEHPGMHRYTSPRGLPALVEAIAAVVGERQATPTSPADVLVATGATGALGAAIGAIVEPGDEVLLAAPHWPLIAGIVRSFHGAPLPVPLVGEPMSKEEAVRRLDEAAGERTVALYLNTPNNPSGAVLARCHLEAIVEWARRRRLWLLADEVYEELLFRGEHTWCRALAPERTFSAHSFSKAYAMAGNRCGYLVGPPEAMPSVLKVGLHAFYSAPTAAQLAALRVLEGRAAAWLEAARSEYRRLGEAAAARLGVEPPAGGTFLFLDVARHLDERGLAGFLETCAERGLLLAPGPSFGPYPTHVRLCFTAAPPQVVLAGVEILADLLGRPPR